MRARVLHKGKEALGTARGGQAHGKDSTRRRGACEADIMKMLQSEPGYSPKVREIKTKTNK